MSDGALITQGEAVEVLEISNKAFYRLVEAGVLRKVLLPGLKYGKYLRAEVEQIREAGFAGVKGKESLVEEFCKTIEQRCM